MIGLKKKMSALGKLFSSNENLTSKEKSSIPYKRSLRTSDTKHPSCFVKPLSHNTEQTRRYSASSLSIKSASSIAINEGRNCVCGTPEKTDYFDNDTIIANGNAENSKESFVCLNKNNATGNIIMGVKAKQGHFEKLASCRKPLKHTSQQMPNSNNKPCKRIAPSPPFSKPDECSNVLVTQSMKQGLTIFPTIVYEDAENTNQSIASKPPVAKPRYSLLKEIPIIEHPTDVTTRPVPRPRPRSFVSA